jgi:Ser/Thr protein kinase RdoA (MazF antagonist)
MVAYSPQQDTRPTFSFPLIQAILQRWGLLGDPLAVNDLGGSYNRNWRIRLVEDDVVVRIRPPWITPQRLGDVHSLQRLLNQYQMATPRLRLSIYGHTYEWIEGRLVEVYDYLPEAEQRHWSTERWQGAFEHMGKLHAAFQQADVAVTPPLVSNYAPPRQLRLLLHLTLQQLEILPRSPEQKEGVAICKAAEQVRLQVEVQLETLRPHLPHQLVHGDFHLDNLLFDEQEHVRYTLDFDFTAWRERLYEIAYALRLALPQLTQNSECRLESSLVRGWLAIYDDSTLTPLTETERAALPYELALAALYFIAQACRTTDPLAQVLRESAYLELACFLVEHPSALLEGEC